MTLRTRLMFSAMALFAGAGTLLAQNYDLGWSTIDGGGGTSSGGAYSLTGTIGQPDAQPPPIMSGGTFTLSGGFWPGLGDACTRPGDLNLDGSVDGADVQAFLNCLLASGTNCGCADLDASGNVNAGDVAPFVAALIN